MKTAKIISAVIFILVLAVSCAPAAEPPGSVQSNSASLPVSTGAPETPAGEPLVLEGGTSWRVIRPEVCSETVLAAAASLDAHLFNRLEVHLTNKNDLAAPSEKEILVGLTNRPESAQVYETLKSKEYAVCIVNRKIVVIGFDDEGTKAAAKWFNETFVDRAARPEEGQKAQLYVDLSVEKRQTYR